MLSPEFKRNVINTTRALAVAGVAFAGTASSADASCLSYTENPNIHTQVPDCDASYDSRIQDVKKGSGGLEEITYEPGWNLVTGSANSSVPLYLDKNIAQAQPISPDQIQRGVGYWTNFSEGQNINTLPQSDSITIFNIPVQAGENKVSNPFYDGSVAVVTNPKAKLKVYDPLMKAWTEPVPCTQQACILIPGQGGILTSDNAAEIEFDSAPLSLAAH